MAVELASIASRRDIPRHVSTEQPPTQQISAGKPNLKLIDNGKIVAQKISFQASLEQASLNQQYWEEILEKLRKTGGGGGGSSRRFDKITTSMMFMNYLSNKTIQAILKNLDILSLKSNDCTQEKVTNINQNIFISSFQKIGKPIFNFLTNMLMLIVRRDAINRVSIRQITSHLSALLGTISFQLNKLKEVLEEELKEKIKKLDVKDKIRRIKESFLDFYIEIKKEILNIIRVLPRLILMLFNKPL